MVHRLMVTCSNHWHFSLIQKIRSKLNLNASNPVKSHEYTTFWFTAQFSFSFATEIHNHNIVRSLKWAIIQEPQSHIPFLFLPTFSTYVFISYMHVAYYGAWVPIQLRHVSLICMKIIRRNSPVWSTFSKASLCAHRH